MSASVAILVLYKLAAESPSECAKRSRIFCIIFIDFNMKTKLMFATIVHFVLKDCNAVSRRWVEI